MDCQGLAHPACSDEKPSAKDRPAGCGEVDAVEARNWTAPDTEKPRSCTNQREGQRAARSMAFDSRGEVIEAEAEIIREMFHRFALGETMKSIARGLNGRKILPPVSFWRRSVRSLMLPLLQSARAPVGFSILLLAFVMGHQPIIAARRRTRCSRSCHPAC